jgi:Domain of unknown function (DUF397)
MDLTGVRWRKASYTSSNGNCVEVGVWTKSSHSSTASSCVEVTATQETETAPHKSAEDVLYMVRDSKDPDGPKLAFTTAEWDAFTAGVKDGEFDRGSF